MGPPFPPDLRRHFGHRGVGEDATVDKLHDIEWRPDDGLVLAENDRLGHGDVLLARGGGVGVVRVQRAEHGIFAFYLVRRVGDELAGGFLAQDKLGFTARN